MVKPDRKRLTSWVALALAQVSLYDFPFLCLILRVSAPQRRALCFVLSLAFDCCNLVGMPSGRRLHSPWLQNLEVRSCASWAMSVFLRGVDWYVSQFTVLSEMFYDNAELTFVNGTNTRKLLYFHLTSNNQESKSPQSVRFCVTHYLLCGQNTSICIDSKKWFIKKILSSSFWPLT